MLRPPRSLTLWKLVMRNVLLSGLAMFTCVWQSFRPVLAQCNFGSHQIKATRTFPAIQPHPGKQLLQNPLQEGVTSGFLPVVALGDSVVWGDGLKDRDKFIVTAAHAIADKTQRTVMIVSYAHSGAHLKLDADAGKWVPMRASDHGTPQGDLDSSLPDVASQATCAAYEHPEAEIVVMDGCINEVGATAIALPPFVNGVDVKQIETTATATCGNSMKAVLQSVKDSFPKATIVLLNYYRIVSDQSRPFNVVSTNGAPTDSQDERAAIKQVKELSKVEAKAEQKAGQLLIAPTKMSKKQQELADTKQKQKWQDNSAAFLLTSHGCFLWAIQSTNVTGAPDMPQGATSCPFVPDPAPTQASATSRIYLAVVEDDPTFAYGGTHKHIWSYSAPFLYFFALRPDEMFGRRRHLCMTHFVSIGDQFKCRINPIAHPNQLGARAYAESIAGSPEKPGLLDAAWALASVSTEKR